MLRHAFALLLVVGCGGDEEDGAADAPIGNDAHPGGDAPPVTTHVDAGTGLGSGTMTWTFNGAAKSASAVLGTRTKITGEDYLEIIGANAAGDGVSFIVDDASLGAGATLGGTYLCSPTGNPLVIFTYITTGSNAPMSCTIGITQPGVVGGAHASGTFSAVLSDGTTIGDGVFDVEVKAPGE